MSPLEAVLSAVTAITAVASGVIAVKGRGRALDSRDKRDAVKEYQRIVDRMDQEMGELRAEVKDLRVQVEVLKAEHSDCQRRLAEFGERISGPTDLTLHERIPTE